MLLDRTLVSPVTLSRSTLISTEYIAGVGGVRGGHTGVRQGQHNRHSELVKI